jgi:hypothetical protein
MVQITICDDCEIEDDNLFTCKLCKSESVEVCKDCIIEHLQEQHAEEILEEQDNMFYDKYMESV